MCIEMDKVALETLGCKLNQAETDSLARQLLSKGHQLAESAREADIYVLNTCTVTHVADRKARHLLRLAHRTNPRALIVAIGCYAQRAPEELGQLGVVGLILGNKQKGRLVEILENRNLRSKGARSPYKEYHSRTRSLIKIQEGCHSFCSFCIVPYIRGQERSLTLEKVIQQVKERVAAGYKEVTLTGTKIGAYRWNGENHSSLPHLIEHILQQTGIKRLRLSSLQPQDLTPELVRLWTDERLCPHLHLPLQSGSQAMLQRMNRPYSIADYERAVSLAREAIPDLAITTDILVGFPGEGEREFEESYRFCQKMGLAKIHVFPYSPRPGTAAARMPHQVDERMKKERSQQMLDLAQQSAQRLREQFLGRTMPVLCEGKSEPGVWSGLTANYLRVFIRSEQELTNRLLPVKLVAEHPQGFLGELANGG
jgi:threonylcarbamoyladenosine tRNA methylthiotransferase MtaB